MSAVHPAHLPTPDPARPGCKWCQRPLDARGRNTTGLCRVCYGQQLRRQGEDARIDELLRETLIAAIPALEATGAALVLLGRLTDIPDLQAHAQTLIDLGNCARDLQPRGEGCGNG